MQILPDASKTKNDRKFKLNRKLTEEQMGQQIESATTVQATPRTGKPKKFSEWSPGERGKAAHDWHRHRAGIHRWVIRNLKSSNRYQDIAIQVRALSEHIGLLGSMRMGEDMGRDMHIHFDAWDLIERAKSCP